MIQIPPRPKTLAERFGDGRMPNLRLGFGILGRSVAHRRVTIMEQFEPDELAEAADEILLGRAARMAIQSVARVEQAWTLYNGNDDMYARKLKDPCATRGCKGRKYWWRYWTRTSDPYNVSVSAEIGNVNNISMLEEDNTPLSVPLSVSHDKPVQPSISGELEGIVRTWPRLPDSIQKAIVAIIAPYLQGIVDLEE